MDYLDFETLREAGIGAISRLANHTWTDHNPSDPGITLLEQLCYALTDLGYRISFEMPDLLAPGGEAAYEVLYTPRDILTTDPVTSDDLRRTLIDLRPIRNASASLTDRLEQALAYAPFAKELLLAKDQDPLLPEDLYQEVPLGGLWSVQTEAHPSTDLGDPTVREEVEQTVRARVQQVRSLCTDISRATVLDRQQVTMQVGIELGDNADPEALLPLIWEKLDQYVSPILPFYDLATFLTGKSVEDAFEGPALTQGFLEAQDVLTFRKRTELRRSDVIRELSALRPQVKAVRSLSVLQATGLTWVVSLDPDLTPFFSLDTTSVQFFQGGVEVNVEPARISELREQYRADRQERIMKQVRQADIDLRPSLREDRAIGQYDSMRHHLPEIFGVGPAGLPPRSGLPAQVSAQQLSGYLLFFEQLLANLFTQLAESWRLFTLDRSDSQSYFTQAPDDIPATEGLYTQPDQTLRADQVQALTEATDSPLAHSRTQRFLDHLLARFAESMTDYTLLARGLTGVASTEAEVIQDKRTFLREYVSLSRRRGTGADYTQPSWNTDNLGGITRRIARLLGIDNPTRRNLGPAEEGFFVLEHILLRPRPGDAFQEGPLLFEANVADPYSNQISYLFAERGRFVDASLQTFASQLVRAETPAHLHVQVYWLNADKLTDFELAYEAFLTALETTEMYADAHGSDHQLSLRIARDRLLDLMATFDATATGTPSYLSTDIRSAPNAIGIPYPIQDLPIPARVTATETTTPGNWEAQIPIFYAQRGVTYVLTDRDRVPVLDLGTGLRIERAGHPIDGQDAQGVPFVYLNTPDNLTESQTYYIRAEKTINPGPESQMRFVYLHQPVRVQIGIVPISIALADIEIDYDTQATLLLSGTQAGVDYRLYDALGNEISVSPQQVAGDPNIVVNFNTPPLYEDQQIYVRGSMDSFASYEEVGISDLIRVRANPNLLLSNANETLAYEQPLALSGLRLPAEPAPGPANPYTQASVTYDLYRREVADRLFVHQQAPVAQPPASEVLEIALNGLPATLPPVRLHRPDVNGGFAITSADVLVGTATVVNDGDALDFGAGSLTLQEDHLFFVVARKTGHTTPVFLHDPGNGRLHMAAAMVAPDPSPTVLVDPSPVVSGTRGRVVIGGTPNPVQPGVRYFLRIAGSDQQGVFVHDEIMGSVRRDGVGLSKVGVDLVIGAPVGATPAIFTDDPLAATTQVEVVAEKAQTGLQAILNGGVPLDMIV